MEKKNQDTTKRGVIYCRVSTHDQVSGTSLPMQKKECIDYAGREEIEVPDAAIFIEEGESATAADRTQ
jgi:DNA invertase Pin-like site-specific DNA recombinase